MSARSSGYTATLTTLAGDPLRFPVRYRLPGVDEWLKGTYTGEFEVTPTWEKFHIIERADGTTVKTTIAQAL